MLHTILCEISKAGRGQFLEHVHTGTRTGEPRFPICEETEESAHSIRTFSLNLYARKSGADKSARSGIEKS